MKRKLILLLLSFTIISTSSKSQNNIISMIETNWNETKTMSGNFTQINNDKSMTYGRFFLSKPFKSKFIYENGESTIITTKSIITIVDDEGYKVDSYPIINSQLKEMLSNKVDLLGVNMEVKVNEENDNYFLHIKDNNNEDEVIFSFNKETLNLEKWEIIDEFNQSTVLEFTKIKKNISISPEIYGIKYKN